MNWKPAAQKVSVALSLLITGGCVDRSQAPLVSNSGQNSEALAVRREVSLYPAYYQFGEFIGHRPFSIHYRPRSRSKSSAATRESSGALVYAEPQDLSGASAGIYVLLAREKKDGKWSFMRGSVERNHTYLQTAQKELFEETRGVYAVTPQVLAGESYDVYHSPTAGNYAATFFVKMDYIHRDLILNHQPPSQLRVFFEMSDYRWVRLEDLVDALAACQKRFVARDPQGNRQSITLSHYIFAILEQAYRKGILQQLH